MGAGKYVVRRGDQQYGPWSLAEVRRFLLTCGDPDPDYPLRQLDDPKWCRASEVPEFADFFDPDSMTVRTTRGETPNGKLKKRKA